MRTRSLPLLVSLLLIVSFAKARQTDIIEVISGYFKTSDAQKISTYFSSTVSLDIFGEENLYSKAQAEQVLRDFFLKNKSTSVKVVHRLTSNPNFRLGVLSLQSGKNRFRVSISLSNSGEKFLIKEIRIEYEKQ